MTLHHMSLAAGADHDGFRQAVRRLWAARIPPAGVLWSAGEDALPFGGALDAAATPVALPRAVGELVEMVVCHRDPQRYALLYALIWRVLGGERTLLEAHADPLVHQLAMMRKAIRRDLHKMHAFLRFRSVAEPDGTERFVAWFEPDHFILDAAAPFFVDRFPAMRWSILTPDGSLHWDTKALMRGPAARKSDAPQADGFEAGWRSYYESIFNPARTNVKAMLTEMPKKYWRNMPETQAIAPLVRGATARVEAMVAAQGATPRRRDPARAVAAMADQAPASLAELNAIIAASEPLVPGATRAVLGEGPMGASIAFVGEQPGDQEDRQGRPFVGPAGQMFDRALAQAGIDREAVYLTNAVKHFKFEQRGKLRLHRNPTAGEVKHYRWWLEKELDFVRPRLVVALGGTAALALAGHAIAVTRHRGPMAFGAHAGFVTVHPSYLLRLPDAAAQTAAYEAFCADLARIHAMAVEQKMVA